MPAPAYGHPLRALWTLEEGLRFLNHGSYGATPKLVLEAQSEWRVRMERQPVRFMTREAPAGLEAVAARLGEFVGAVPGSLVFVENATTGANTVLRSLDLAPADEIVISRHAYPGIRNTAQYAASRSGARVVEAPTPFPAAAADEIADAYTRATTKRTRLAIVDHIGSPTAVVHPVGHIVRACHMRGVPVLVDGAHAPGSLPLDLAALDADWYTGNCHKWLFAPRGCAFLATAPRLQPKTRPLVISNFAGEGYAREFAWCGTRDPSAFLALGAALDFWQQMGGAAIRAWNHRLVIDAAARLNLALKSKPTAPKALLAGMATLKLPWNGAVTQQEADRLHDWLLAEGRIEVPVLAFDRALWCRISGQIYNELDDYLALSEALREALATLARASPAYRGSRAAPRR
jgi:isopenicillin-N epimerase